MYFQSLSIISLLEFSMSSDRKVVVIQFCHLVAFSVVVGLGLLSLGFVQVGVHDEVVVKRLVIVDKQGNEVASLTKEGLKVRGDVHETSIRSNGVVAYRYKSIGSDTISSLIRLVHDEFGEGGQLTPQLRMKTSTERREREQPGDLVITDQYTWRSDLASRSVSTVYGTRHDVYGTYGMMATTDGSEIEFPEEYWKTFKAYPSRSLLEIPLGLMAKGDVPNISFFSPTDSARYGAGFAYLKNDEGGNSMISPNSVTLAKGLERTEQWADRLNVVSDDRVRAAIGKTEITYPNGTSYTTSPNSINLFNYLGQNTFTTER